MILLSVGTQLPFNRLVMAVDDWAASESDVDIVAQVGQTSYLPRAMKSFDFIAPAEFRRLQEQARVFVSHAGMGSILAALEFRRPIIVMPRDHMLGEHRNNHQFATANWVRDIEGIHVAETPREVVAFLERFETLSEPSSSTKPATALIQRLRDFLAEQDG